MIKKIRKYKLNLRPHSILRNLKKKINLELAPDSLEKKVQEEIAKAQTLILPSAIYNSYSKSETPEPLKPLWQVSSQQALSLSTILTTIGPLLEKEMGSDLTRSEELRPEIIDAIAREALEQSHNFVAKLIAEEAKSDGCELSPPLFSMEPVILKELLTLLESHKAEISLDANGLLVPTFTTVSYCFWNPVSRGKRRPLGRTQHLPLRNLMRVQSHQ